MQLHWDGNNTSSPSGTSARRSARARRADRSTTPALKRVRDWILDAASRRATRASRIDAAISRRAGARVGAEQHCAACHAFKGKRRRARSRRSPRSAPTASGSTPSRRTCDNQDTLGTGKPGEFSHFRKTNGYANQPLDGVWLRAPYLHNGSVPTLARPAGAPSSSGPSRFYRGYDVYDPDQGRLHLARSPTPSASRLPVRHAACGATATAATRYGTDLPEADKAALIEYMKTL